MAKKVIIPVIILLSSIFIMILLTKLKSEPPKREQKQTTMLVDVLGITPGSIDFNVQTQGTVLPHTETTLVSEISGVVLTLSPDFVAGGTFKKGDILLRIDPTDYKVSVQQAKAKLAGAEAQLAQEVARAEQAKKDWQTFSKNNANRKPSSLVLRKPYVDEAKANVLSAKADLANAKRKLERTLIRAPYDGMVEAKLADIGQYVGIGTQVGQIFATDYAEVRLPLTSNDLALIHLPSKKQNQTPAVVELSTQYGREIYTWNAQLIRMEGVIDQKSRVHYAIAKIKEPYNVENSTNTIPLKKGTFVKAKIKGKNIENIIAVPRYLLKGHNQLITLDNENKIRFKMVDIIEDDEEYVYISSGLTAQDRLVTTSIETPVEGMLVRVSESNLSKKKAGDN